MSKHDDMSTALRTEELPIDATLKKLTREQILQRPSFERLRWFHMLQMQHAELVRVVGDVLELLDGDAETRIVALVGMTAAGKTTCTRAVRNALIRRYRTDASDGAADMPVLYISAPANGERSLSWRVIYGRMLHGGGLGVLRGAKATHEVSGRLEYAHGAMTVAALREFVETMIRERNVRVCMIDEAFHLTRFGESGYAAVMDTLKSLADIDGFKLLLIGNYDLADMMVEYAQVARRTEIVHFRPYLDVEKGKLNQPVELKAPPPKPKAGETSNEWEFYMAVQKYQDNWPCQNVPDLCAMWWPLMLMSVGAIGLLKMALCRLAHLQMKSKTETITKEMFGKMRKTPAALDKIHRDVVKGSESLKDATYGSPSAQAMNDEQFLRVVGGRRNG
ncbi:MULTISPECIES: ATP-binding protein [unclassified Roseateles]|uniref:ATP-binding protein n=1 Tax=unclassified Roseateles TaxID=2626991 RepID=UPI0006F59318|nr:MULTISPECIES: ATP-binding protein [unclassified Roseateles]KQW49520.1 hypothetical protein ASC81_25685 [Pelomonas sp. Root405]KRA75578.1 hypothetical protein ASD88_25670 [Pelomonas sp. Root662]